MVMTLPAVRRIRGNVHGSIDVSELEDLVIAHPYFQRLRRIKQLAFLNYVFPGATHSRFEHSLGVMHMAGVAWNKLRQNQQRLGIATSKIPNFATLEQSTTTSGISHGLLAPTLDDLRSIFDSPYTLQAFRLAGLLHDVGHPPFSHSGERFLPTYHELARANPDLPDFLKKYLEDHCRRIEGEGFNPKATGVRHEILSALMINKLLTDIYQKNPHLKLKIEPQDVTSIIVPQIEPVAGSPIVIGKVYGILRELISGELDIDRMDYLLRDARECGVVYGIFDESRILDSICLYFDPEDQAYHVAIGISGLAAFEDYLRARHSMYLQLYFHKTAVAAEAMMQHISKLIGGYRLPSQIDAYAALDEFNIGPELIHAGQSLNQSDQLRLNRLTTELLYHRKLWKRIYEVTSSHPGKDQAAGLEQVKTWLEQRQIPFEELSSANSLTRFRPRDRGQRSRNYLRLVKKDERQILRVLPIEDFCQVIHENNAVSISRLYIDPEGLDINQMRLDIQKSLLS